MAGLTLDDACARLREPAPPPLLVPEAFEACFEGLAEQGMMGGLPRTAGEVPDAVAGPGHEAALRKRLHRLGYLASSTVDAAALAAGLRLFQAEAGLVVDGWPGARTWEALQQLFTFEERFEAERWFEPAPAEGVSENQRPRPRLALRRAILLRLQAYGVDADDGLEAAFGVWLERARRLGWEPDVPGGSEGPEAITPERVRRLFDHDGLVAFAATDAARCQPKHYAAHEAEMRRFLLSLAKVELWMNGYPVAPDGDTRLSVRTMVKPVSGGGAGGRRPRRIVRRDSPFFGGVESFLSDTEGPAVPSVRTVSLRARAEDDRLDESIAAILLRTRELRRADEDARAPRLSDEELADIVLSEPEPARFWDRLVTTARSLATSLFDGIKRVWRWLRERVMRVGQWVGEALINLTRLVWNRLTEIGRIVRAAIAGFAEGVRYFVRPTLTLSDRGSVVIAHQIDFDFRLYVIPETVADIMQVKLRALRRGTAAWQVACDLMGLLLMVSRGALRGTSGVGLVFFASALIRVAGRVRELGASLSEYRSLDFDEPVSDDA